MPYAGTVTPMHAYDLLGQDIDWKKAKSFFTIHTRSAGTSEAEFLGSLKKYLDETKAYAPDYGLRSFIVLVMGDHIAVYEAWDKAMARSEYHETLDSDMPTGELQFSERSEVPMDISLYQMSVGPIWPGQGIKIFETRK